MPADEPSVLPPGRRVELPGRGTTFVREVAGPRDPAATIVLLHGLSATGGLNWVWAFGPLGQRFRVVALDHRGHGRGIRTRRFRLSDCADDVAALVDELGLGPVVVAGYSMGGPIAQLTWHRHQDKVAGMVLCATSRDFRGHPREQALFGLMPAVTLAASAVPAPARRLLQQRLLDSRLPDFAARDWVLDELSRNDPATVAQAALAIGRYSSHDWIGDVDVPTAVVVTTKDRLVPPHRQQKLADSIPGATVHPVAGDHGVCVAQPNLFVPALMAACRTVASRIPIGSR